MAAAGRGRGRSSIHRSAARDRDEEGDQCMQSALGEGDREGNNFCANLEDRDKETEVLGGDLLMLDIGADFPLGPTCAIRPNSAASIAPSGTGLTREFPQKRQATSSTERRCSESTCNHARPRRPNEGSREPRNCNPPVSARLFPKPRP